MTAKEIQKRNAKGEHLKVLQTEDGQFFVESAEGKILYGVSLENEGNKCTCGDFAKNVKKDPNHNCKHILSVMNAIPKKEIETVTFLAKQMPKLDERFITIIEGKEFVKYPGLLDLGHQKGISSIEVDIVQLPTKENEKFAVCKAIVTSKTGEVFSDVGDASPQNCNSKVAKHVLRMSATRALARALRSYCAIGITCLSELEDFNDVISNGAPKKETRKRSTGKDNGNGKSTKAPAERKPPATTKDQNNGKPPKPDKSTKPAKTSTKPAEAKTKDQTQTPENNQPNMSEAQKRAIYNLSRRRGISVEELETMALDTYSCELENLCSKDASTFIRNLQQAA
jgi:predicted nucleic acid-binding Zn finger protein